MRAAVFGFYLFLVHILGSAPAPAIVGWVSDTIGDLRFGVIVAPLIALVGSAVAFWGSRYIEEDERRMLEHLRSIL
jgi:fucose permease